MHREPAIAHVREVQQSDAGTSSDLHAIAVQRNLSTHSVCGLVIKAAYSERFVGHSSEWGQAWPHLAKKLIANVGVQCS
jgi:hypothetical protein